MVFLVCKGSGEVNVFYVKKKKTKKTNHTKNHDRKRNGKSIKTLNLNLSQLPFGERERNNAKTENSIVWSTRRMSNGLHKL